MEITKIQKWGNSLAVRLPRSMTKSLHLKEGNVVSLTQKDISLYIQRVKNQHRRSKEWKAFLIPTKKKKHENVSEHIDTILYGNYRR